MQFWQAQATSGGGDRRRRLETGLKLAKCRGEFWVFGSFFHLLETENTHLNGRPEWARFLRCKSHGVGSIGRPFEIGREGWNRMAGIKWGSPGATIAIEKGNFSSKVFSKTKKWIKNPKRQ